MKTSIKFHSTLIPVLSLLLASTALAQQDTNAPRTKLETFDTQTNRIIIKGMSQPLSVFGNAGTASVAAKMSTEPLTGRREYGLAIAIIDSANRGESALVDYDELESFLAAIDYFSKFNASSAALPNFDGVYRTRSGLRVSARNSSRGLGVDVAVHIGDPLRGDPVRVTLSLTQQQLAQFGAAVAQARNQLDSLRSAK